MTLFSENVELPSTWAPMTGEMLMAPLAPDSKEYKFFIDEMNKTSGGAKPNIIKVGGCLSHGFSPQIHCSKY